MLLFLLLVLPIFGICADENNWLQEDILSKWAQQISEGTYDEVMTYSRANSLQAQMDELLTLAFKPDRKIVDNLIKFGMTLDKGNEQLAAYESILDSIKANGFIDNPETVKLAFLVRDLGRSNSNNTQDDEINRVRSKFPQAVGNLAWEWVCLFNNQDQEYIAPYAIEDHLRRNIHTNKFCDRWNFEPENNYNFYYIRGDNGEYLYAETDEWAYNEYARRIFMRRDKQRVARGRWEIFTINNGELYLFRNTYENEYLFTSNRQVATWRRKGAYQSQECYWKVLA